VIANKIKYQRDEAIEIARKADTVLVAKGKKLLRFELSENVTDDELAAVILGRSGTLRAPAISIGRTFVVGYHADGYGELFQ
jgi:hypothetical protein